jgi:4a-hydroxytetrahydrobiopterin dehydratase
MKILTDAEISTALKRLSGWKLDRGAITQTFPFTDFPEAIAFVNRVALCAETAGHHPDIDIRWNKVRLTLSTHDSGGVTPKDIELAENILQIFRP